MKRLPIALATLVLLLVTCVGEAASPDIVISQVYGGGGNSGATLKNDFVELFNRGATTVSVTGWSVQYASATGSSWQVTALSGSIAPGAYYLVREAPGAGGTFSLPTPDATGTIAMSATAGKVALANVASALAGTCPAGATVVDVVGYGTTANCSEGSPTPALSNTTAALRNASGCTDTNNNASDFSTGAPSPRNAGSPFNDCSAPPPPTLVLTIHEIQGSGSTSPYVGQIVTTTLSIVTGLKTNGFFIQTPQGQEDADPATSEGVFVFTSSAPPAGLHTGDAVTVRGTVQEYVPSSDPSSPPTTEIGASPFVTIVSAGNPLPPAVTLTAADTSPAGSIEQLERYEGMRVHVDALTVVAPTQGSVNEANATSTTNGTFYGVVTGVARPFREAGIAVPDPLPPGSPCCIPRFDGNPERLRVDSDGQPGAAALEVTAGAVVANLTGPLDYAYRTYTILPDPPPAAAPSVSGILAATPVRPPAGDEFTVASFNMERFFDTVNDPGVDDVALKPAAFETRLSKASLAIRTVLESPDILGVVEVENLSTLQAVAGRVNADAVAAGDPDPNYQAYLVEGNDVGGIDVGFLVKGAPRATVLDVTQEGKDATYVSPVSGLPELLNDRPSLVLRAAVTPGSGPAVPVTVIVNHLRSLSGVDDPADGPRVRAKRRAQAEFLADLVQARQTANPNERIVLVGDFNAYQFNDGYVDVIGTVKGTPAPADEVVLASNDLVTPDLTNLVDTLPADERYSYSFDGDGQVLDHVLVTANLLELVRTFTFARNDADFPESTRAVATRPERISDHDMPVAYFRFPSADLSLAASASASSVVTGTDVTFTLTVSNAGPTTATGVTVTDELPAALTFVSCASTGSGTCGGSGSHVTVTFPSLASGASSTITLGATLGCDLADGAAVSNTATVSSATADPDASNDAATVDLTASNPPPSIDTVTPSPSLLWPPNRKMVAVTVAYAVSDNCDAAPGCVLSVTSNEPLAAGDAVIVDAHHVRLRADRLGSGSGRTYTIAVTCTDAEGSASTRAATVTVPHDQGP